MKCLIVYQSIHHGNTEKIAREMANILDADLKKPQEIELNICDDCDVMGFGSGIYFSRHHKALLRFAENITCKKRKKAFIFSSSGLAETKHLNDFNKKLKDILVSKGFEIIGVYSCRGFDTWGPFKVIGGINKGKPGEDDLENARKFAQDLKNKYWKSKQV